MSLLNDILDDAGEAPKVESPETEKPEIQNKNDSGSSLEFQQLEVGGVLVDKYGNKWQVPGGNVDDISDLYASDPYANLPEQLLADFHVQGIPVSRLEEFMHRGFVPVRIEEAKVPEAVIRMTGKPLDGYHMVGDMLLVKIPRMIYERIQKAKVKEVKKRLAETEPTADMLKRAAESGLTAKVTQKHSVTPQEGERQGVYANDKGEI